MDKNLQTIITKRVNRTIKNLELNNMNGYFVDNINELHLLLNKLIIDKAVVSVGGSMTLFETDTINYLKNRNLTFLNRYKEGLTTNDIKQLYRDSFFADVYLASSNAITEKGELYNVDGTGNRVAAMTYGPDKVVLIVGVNKIVKNIDDAIKRNREIAAPANGIRLNKNTPCTELGYCTDCKCTDKMCNIFSTITSQSNKDRMHVIFINESYGY